MTRTIKYIVLHCTATDANVSVANIQRYWRNELGWKNPGYHFIVDKSGRVTQLQPLSKPSNGVRGYNQNSIHISWIGGKNGIDNRTKEQKIALESLVKSLHAVYPNAEIKGHRDFLNVKKDCPSFDVKRFLRTIKL